MFIVYAMVGAVGTLVQYAFLLASVSWLHVLEPVAATVIGAFLGAIVNYCLNARFTFRDSAGTHRVRVVKFAVTAIFGMLMNGLIMHVFSQVLGLNYMLVQLFATAVVLVLTYSINRVWTFGVAAHR
ncbi:GtrA family protein [Herbaspirillum sp. alder98]|uniref:GtrA family protein n=1 Tax=Herbaspirillum sp. alder98 TaxID=2913096 RepID=UPI001CD88E50|nr:GtrA family protein [Herbaspirillum sp. alder98]MCA1322641.1 GtrA family protein [Herbaspirillum sp. alder98]